MYIDIECRLVYLEYHSNFIGSPQHFMSPLQHASVEQISSPHVFTTLSSNPHPSQERR